VVDGSRFMTLTDVAEVLNISASQTYALVRSGDLAAIKVGGRGQWRVERSQLEDYIARMYAQTAQFVADHPLGAGDDTDDSHEASLPEDSGAAAAETTEVSGPDGSGR
jgi:excisionase family DNA binding protein